MKKVVSTPDFDKVDRSNLTRTLSDKNMLALISSYNERYLHYSEIGYRVNEKQLNDLWIAMRTIRKATAQAVAIGDIRMEYNITPLMQSLLRDIDRWSFNGDINNRSSERYRLSSMMEEAIASSQMEGSSTTRDVAKRILRRDDPRPKSTDERMIVNNYLTMEEIRGTIEQKMSVPLILSLHGIMTKGLLGEWEGRFREDDKTVVGDPLEESVIYHEPPKAETIPGLMQSLCDFVNSKDDKHPIVKGIIIHFMIGHIHPFTDGNGRIARTLFYWYAIKEGYDVMQFASISRIIKRSRNDYNLAYQYSESDDNDVTYFVKYNLECITDALEEFEEYLERKMKVIHIDTGGSKINSLESSILDDYDKSEKFTIREISKRYAVAYQSARNYVNHLLELGLIEESGKERKTVLYRVKIINRPDIYSQSK